MKKCFILLVINTISILTTVAQSKEDYYKSAFDELGNNNFTIARATCDEGIKKYGKDYLLYSVRGTARFNLKDYNGALEDYNSMLAMKPSDHAAYFLRGVVKFETQQYDEAITDFNKAIGEGSEVDKKIYYYLGQINDKKKLYVDAIKEYTKVIHIDKNNEEAYYHRAISRGWINQYSDAIADYTKAIELDSSNTYYYSQRACMEKAVDMYTEAMKDCNKAIQLDHNNPTAYLIRGAIYYKMNKQDEALSDFNTANTLNTLGPQNKVDVYNWLAYIKSKAGLFSAALYYCNQLISIYPQNADAYRIKGDIERDGKKYDDAIRDYQKGLSLDPQNSSCYLGTGHIKLGLHQYEDAIKNYNTSIQTTADNPVAYAGRGAAKSSLGRFEEALADYESAIKLDPSYFYAYYERGNTLCATGDYSNAMKDLEMAIQLDSTYAYTYNVRGYVYYKTGDYKQAFADYDKALKTGGPNYTPRYAYRTDTSLKTNLKSNFNTNATFNSLAWLEPFSPEKNLYTLTGKVSLKIKIMSGKPVEKEKIKIQVNNQQLSSGNKMTIVELKPKNSSKVYESDYISELSVPKGNNTISIKYNDAALPDLKVQYQPGQTNLHVIAIGTNTHGTRYAENDATDFADLFSQQNNTVFNNVTTAILKGKDAEAKNFCQAINSLAKENFTDNDVLFLFISSHGLIIKDELYLSGSDFDDTYINQTTIRFKDQILLPLRQLHCKTFIFLDACHSGVIGTLRKELEKTPDLKTSLTVITSSQEKELSWEDEQWKNGAFTKALKEGLSSGQADQNGDNIIDLNELFEYMNIHIPILVQEAGKKNIDQPAAQHPVMFNRPDNGLVIYAK